jgi:hypothetical protein
VSLLVLLLALDVDKAPVEAGVGEEGAFPKAAGLEGFELLDCDLNLALDCLGLSNNASSSTSSDTQTEILNILQIIRSEQKKTNSRVVDTNKRINALYSEYDEEEYDENQNYDIDYYDDTGDEVPNHDNTSTADSVSVEPPKKKAEIRCD